MVRNTVRPLNAACRDCACRGCLPEIAGHTRPPQRWLASGRRGTRIRARESRVEAIRTHLGGGRDNRVRRRGCRRRTATRCRARGLRAGRGCCLLLLEPDGHGHCRRCGGSRGRQPGIEVRDRNYGLAGDPAPSLADRRLGRPGSRVRLGEQDDRQLDGGPDRRGRARVWLGLLSFFAIPTIALTGASPWATARHSLRLVRSHWGDAGTAPSACGCER